MSEPFAAAAPPPVAPVTTMRSAHAPNELEVVDTPPPESLGEEDVIDEIPSDMLESIPPSGGVAAAAEAEEEPPISSQRPRGLMELDDALAGADEESLLDEEREVPLKTPPPESGPQEAPLPAGLAAPAAPDVEGLLEADLRSAPEAAPAPGPTPVELGETIELAEGRGPAIELAPAPPNPAPPAPPEELEMPLPAREAAGHYTAELLPPTQARGELEAQRAGEAGTSEESTAQALPESDVAQRPRGEEAAAHADALPVDLIGRPPLESGTVIRAERTRAPSPRPSTFLELLDASITLGDK